MVLPREAGGSACRRTGDARVAKRESRIWASRLCTATSVSDRPPMIRTSSDAACVIAHPHKYASIPWASRNAWALQTAVSRLSARGACVSARLGAAIRGLECVDAPRETFHVRRASNLARAAGCAQACANAACGVWAAHLTRRRSARKLGDGSSGRGRRCRSARCLAHGCRSHNSHAYAGFYSQHSYA